MEFTYTPHGVCSRQILLELDGNKVSNVRFIGGCSGNTQGVARLAEGMEVDELISRLQGIRCGSKPTSCPDQLAKALLAAKAGATYVSPFVGRLDDISEDGEELVAHIVRVYRTYGFRTQVLAASIRHTRHIIQCLDAGADVATCPLSAIKGLLRHPLTESGLAQFLADHARVNG